MNNNRGYNYPDSQQNFMQGDNPISSSKSPYPVDNSLTYQNYSMSNIPANSNNQMYYSNQQGFNPSCEQSYSLPQSTYPSKQSFNSSWNTNYSQQMMYNQMPGYNTQGNWNSTTGTYDQSVQSPSWNRPPDPYRMQPNPSNPKDPYQMGYANTYYNNSQSKPLYNNQYSSPYPSNSQPPYPQTSSVQDVQFQPNLSQKIPENDSSYMQHYSSQRNKFEESLASPLLPPQTNSKSPANNPITSQSRQPNMTPQNQQSIAQNPVISHSMPPSMNPNIYSNPSKPSSNLYSDANINYSNYPKPNGDINQSHISSDPIIHDSQQHFAFQNNQNLPNNDKQLISPIMADPIKLPPQALIGSPSNNMMQCSTNLINEQPTVNDQTKLVNQHKINDQNLIDHTPNLLTTQVDNVKTQVPLEVEFDLNIKIKGSETKEDLLADKNIDLKLEGAIDESKFQSNNDLDEYSPKKSPVIPNLTCEINNEDNEQKLIEEIPLVNNSTSNSPCTGPPALTNQAAEIESQKGFQLPITENIKTEEISEEIPPAMHFPQPKFNEPMEIKIPSETSQDTPNQNTPTTSSSSPNKTEKNAKLKRKNSKTPKSSSDVGLGEEVPSPTKPKKRISKKNLSLESKPASSDNAAIYQIKDEYTFESNEDAPQLNFADANQSKKKRGKKRKDSGQESVNQNATVGKRGKKPKLEASKDDESFPLTIPVCPSKSEDPEEDLPSLIDDSMTMSNPVDNVVDSVQDEVAQDQEEIDHKMNLVNKSIETKETTTIIRPQDNNKKSKKRPISTLIKKKKKKSIEEDENSDNSDPDVSHRVSRKNDEDRRSSRKQGQNVKYNIESVDFGLSDDYEDDDEDKCGDSNQNGLALFNNEGSEVEIKVVEKILGRRMGKRIMDKLTTTTIIENPNSIVKEETSSVDSQGNAGDSEQKIEPEEIKTQVKTEEIEETVEEFYVKYKGLSYLHCEWKTIDEINDPRFMQKVKRYYSKFGMDDFADEDDLLFNMDYIEVERVLDVRLFKDDEMIDEDQKQETCLKKSQKKKLKKSFERNSDEGEPSSVPSNELDDVMTTATNTTSNSNPTCEETNENMMNDSKNENGESQISTYYLVKWRSLPYEESTWELAQDVDPRKVKLFYKYRYPSPEMKPSPRDSQKKIIRPDPKSWNAIKIDDQSYKNNNKLREYQIEGVNWLAFCWYNKRNCILADEMGLGKTVQSICFVLEVFKAGVTGPYLIIVPLSTVGNWSREFENWSDLNIVVYHGSSVSRSMIQEYEMFYKKSKKPNSGYRNDIYKFNAVITTFEVLMSDIEFFGSISWSLCIIDEAHRLKNKKCKLGEGLRYLNLDHRVLLTGTPLQNNVEELFGLLNFLEPEKFSSVTNFLAEYGELKNEEQVENLKSVLKPMMLRRLKEDVEKSLAPKEETIIEVELTNMQKKYYRAIMERNFTFLSKGCSGSSLPSLLNIMMELRKCCNHPFLIRGAEDSILQEMRTSDEKMMKLPTEESKLFHALIYASGKLVLIHKLLPKLKAGGHKVLIFSQMVRILDILEDYIVHQGYQFERIDGRCQGLMRQEAIDRFSTNPDKFVFLLCTKAGGLGINLTAADVVIIYDSDWNPQNDLQAQARCHRIGQEKSVKVYRLITRNTYEREMFDRASLKLGLNKVVLENMGGPKKSSETGRPGQLSKQEVEALLKKGAYGALMDDDKAGEDFCEEDIDQILQSRAQVVTLEKAEKNNSFSKATFTVSNNKDDIELDDPQFWQKWAKKAGMVETPVGLENMICEPRIRRQTTRYSAQIDDNSVRDGSNSNKDNSIFDYSDAESKSSFDDDDQDAGRKKKSKTLRNEVPLEKQDLTKLEKFLMTFGWGRWKEFHTQANLKKPVSTGYIIRVCKAIIAFCMAYHPVNSDLKTRLFLGELIKHHKDTVLDRCSIQDIQNKIQSFLNGHSVDIIQTSSIISVDEAEMILQCDSFLKHLQRTGDKLLNRIEQIYFLSTEIIGLELGNKFLNNAIECDDFVELEDKLPTSEQLSLEPNVEWWDKCADKCLILGIFKHGWEKYIPMQKDRSLCFARRIADYNQRIADSNQNIDLDEDADEERSSTTEKPDTAVTPGAENSDIEMEDGNFDNGSDNNDDLKKKSKLKSHKKKPQMAAWTKLKTASKKKKNSKLDTIDGETDVSTNEPPKSFPSSNELNIRVRALMNFLIKEFQNKNNDQTLALLEEKNIDFSIPVPADTKDVKWSRREETDFYRVVSSFGVELNRPIRINFFNKEKTKSPESLNPSLPLPRNSSFYNWSNFRQMANLGRKTDQSITDYYHAFYKMCQRVCKRPNHPSMDHIGSNVTSTSAGMSNAGQELNIDLITEERASRTLVRIDLLNRIRCDVLKHPQLGEKLKIAKKSNELPEWWIDGKHDEELLHGIAKHGLARTDYNLLPDPEYSFSRIATMIHDNLRKKSALLEKLINEKDGAPLSDVEINSMRNQYNSSVKGSRQKNIVSVAIEAAKNAALQYMEAEGIEIPEGFRKDLDDKSDEKDYQSDESGAEPLSEQAEWCVKFTTNLAISWPKDKTLQNRLENICYLIEKGEWPTKKITTLETSFQENKLTNIPSTSSDIGKKLSTDASGLSEVEQVALLQLQQDQLLALIQASALAQSAGNNSINNATMEQLLTQFLSVRAMQEHIMSTSSITSAQVQQITNSQNAKTPAPANLPKEETKSLFSAASLAKSEPETPPTNSCQDSVSDASSSNSKRKRKTDAPQHISTLATIDNKLNESTDDLKKNLPSSKEIKSESTVDVPKSKMKSSDPSMNVNIPLIDLVTGALIQGDKAPKRKDLESWLLKNPNHMPYSVEKEDHEIFNKIAKLRGQDTSAMEALAFKHYMNSLMSSNSGQSTPSSPLTPAIPSSSKKDIKNNNTLSNQQKEQQQQQQMLYALYSVMMESVMYNHNQPSSSSPSPMSNTNSQKHHLQQQKQKELEQQQAMMLMLSLQMAQMQQQADITNPTNQQQLLQQQQLLASLSQFSNASASMSSVNIPGCSSQSNNTSKPSKSKSNKQKQQNFDKQNLTNLSMTTDMETNQKMLALQQIFSQANSTSSNGSNKSHNKNQSSASNPFSNLLTSNCGTAIPSSSSPQINTNTSVSKNDSNPNNNSVTDEMALMMALQMMYSQQQHMQTPQAHHSQQQDAKSKNNNKFDKAAMDADQQGKLLASLYLQQQLMSASGLSDEPKNNLSSKPNSSQSQQLNDFANMLQMISAATGGEGNQTSSSPRASQKEKKSAKKPEVVSCLDLSKLDN